jgi:hypothetical protein
MNFANDIYRVEVAGNGRYATLASASGDELLSLSLLAAVDDRLALDETVALQPAQRHNETIVVERRSTLWERAWLELRCLDTSLEVHTRVRGRGSVTDVRLLGGRSLIAGAPLGLAHSGTGLRTLFTPNPEDGSGHVRTLGEGAVIGVLGDGEPGRGRWLFTPAPLYIALADDPETETWLGLGLGAPVADLRFVELAVDAAANGFSLQLDFEGETSVDGDFRAPVVLITPAVPGPYAGLRRHRDDLVGRAVAPAPSPRRQAPWWTEPIFCGWGAQCHLERISGGLARDYATQEHYDGFLARLDTHGLVPGTIVLDDKWQATYGGNEPDVAKWPDLKRWIAQRHERGQHVLLWWKAWDPEGLAPEGCVTNPDGVPVAVDPNNPATRDELRRIVVQMLSPGGLDADGLKVDFTARTPAGRALIHHGGAWGIALLHELLSIVYAAAKDAKPDALVVTHTPHPSFVDVTDMIRLNDMLSGEIVPQMSSRAEVVRAACPELLIDTDDWRVPDKRSWRAFLDVKAQIGVPSLYYASHLDATGEELDADDYAALRSAWDEWKARAA